MGHLQADVRLKIAGDGPLAGDVQAASDADQRIEWMGKLDKEKMGDFLGDCLLDHAIGLLRNFGLTIVESFAKGRP